jgi:hypothetical protein
MSLLRGEKVVQQTTNIVEKSGRRGMSTDASHALWGCAVMRL